MSQHRMMALDRLLKSQWFPLAGRIGTLVLFIVMLVALSLGSVSILGLSFTSGLAMLIIWTLWWPFLYITLFVLGRGWCGFLCPLSLANEVGNSLRRGKAVNVAKWSFVAYILFFAIVLVEQVSGLFLSPLVTLAFLGLFFLIALVMGILWRRLSFCSLVCPIGTLLGAFSRLSPLGVRTDSDTCRACKTYECLKGTDHADTCPVYIHVPSMQSNRDCLLCTYCIKNCPYGSAKMAWIPPGEEIIREKGFRLSESLFIIALLGLTAILTTNGTALARDILDTAGVALTGAWLRGADFIIAISASFLVYGAASFLSAGMRWSRLRESISRHGYASLPLAFLIMSFTVIFGFLGPYLPLEAGAVALTKYLVILGGLAWSLVLLFRLDERKSELVPHAVLLAGIAALWLFVLIPGPLALMHPAESVLELVPGEMVQMGSFSMGYTPSVLIAQKDMPVELNITNRDINHAFDIDEFNVHLVIAGGRTARVMFTPDKAGTFEFYCSIPGHREAGMAGKLIVKE